MLIELLSTIIYPPYKAYHSYSGNSPLRNYNQVKCVITLQFSYQGMIRSMEKHTKEHT